MQITEVRIKLMDDPSERLKAFCSITIDNCFVIRDLKIIDGSNGPFVAMPSRKLTAHCQRCGCKNHLRAGYCNQCGLKLGVERTARDDEGRAKLYADIAHPINTACREMVQLCVIEAFEQEMERAQQPDYKSRYDDEDLELDLEEVQLHSRTPAHRVDPAATEVPPPASAGDAAKSAVPPLAKPQEKAQENTQQKVLGPHRAEPAHESGGPAGPHKPATHKPASQEKPSARRGGGSDFGAGIF